MSALTQQLTFDTYQNLLILFQCLWWLVLAIWLDMLAPAFLWDPIGQRTGHPVPSITRLIVKIVIYAVALMLMVHFVYGLTLGNIGAVSSVMGIILGIALQNLILDAFAGIMLNIEQPFKILQWIRFEHRDFGQLVGQVLEMNWRTTRLWTSANNIISIPNSAVSKARITNFATPTSASRLEFMIVLDIAIPTMQARQLLKQGVQRAVENGKVLSEPQPDVVVVAIEDTNIRYNIRFYVNLALVSDSSALSDAVDGVVSLLTEKGIDFSSSQQRVYIERAGNARQSIKQTSFNAPLTPEMPAIYPISPEQVCIIKHTWSLVIPIANSAAQMFYERLFQLDPSLKALFRTEPDTQRMKRIAMLSIIVRGIGDLDNLIGTVQELGMRHVNYGIQDAHYNTVGAALLWTFEQSLGEEWTFEAKAAWVTAYGILSSTMKSAM